MEGNNNGEGTAKNPKRRGVAGLTAARLKRIQEFKIVSGTDSSRYGRLGSPKWARELEIFIADRRVTLEDIHRWMNTNTEVTEPLPERQKSNQKIGRSPDELSSVTGEAVRTCRNREASVSSMSTAGSSRSRSPSVRSRSASVISRASSVSSRVSSTDTQYFQSTGIRSRGTTSSQPFNILFSPSPVKSEPDSLVTEFDVLSFGNVAQITSPEYSQVHSGAQNQFIPPNPPQQVFIAQQPDTSSKMVVLKDVQKGFFALKTLDQLAKKYTSFQPTFVPQIGNMYTELEELQMINIFGEIPRPCPLALKRESDSETEWFEFDGITNNQVVDRFLYTKSGMIQKIILIVIFVAFPLILITLFFYMLY